MENRADARKPSVKFHGVSIEPGKDIEKVADFSGGLLTVKALRNGKPCRAYCGIYKSQADRETGEEKVNEGWAGEEGFQLPPGAYDVVVENQQDLDRPSVNFHAVAIEAGKPVEKIAEFSGGSLKVKALRNAKTPSGPIASSTRLMAMRDKESVKVAEGWTELDGAVFQFTPRRLRLDRRKPGGFRPAHRELSGHFDRGRRHGGKGCGFFGRNPEGRGQNETGSSSRPIARSSGRRARAEGGKRKEFTTPGRVRKARR